MKVSLLLFAALREAIGARSLDFEIADGATVADLKRRVSAAFPASAALIDRTAVAVDDEYVSSEERLRDGTSVALIPPVSGGAETDDDALFRITPDVLDAQQLYDLVRRDDCGAVALFYGIVRNFSEGRDVERLEYEAHESMALKVIRRCAEETKQRFPDIAVVGVWHRVGLLEIGETSLLVAVASPHRAEAFEACHWAVDRVKDTVPVWKKEHWAGGSAWLEGHEVVPPELAH